MSEYCGVIIDGKVVSYRGNGGHIVVPEGVTEIANGAYEFPFSSITKVTLPKSVKRIGDRAFSYNEEMREIEIPEGVEEIGKQAFNRCHSLKSIVIPSTVVSIGAGAFDECGNIESITVAEGNPVYHSKDNCLIDTKRKVLLRGCKNSVIPSDGSVTAIGDGAFSNDSAHPRNNVNSRGITEIVIPDVITKIGKYAFDFNFRLKELFIPKSVKTIDKCAFSRCPNLTELTFSEGLQRIGDKAFACCTGLTGEVVLPKSVVSIGAGAFSESNIKGIKAFGEIKTVGKNAFDRCKKLKRAEITGSAEELGERAFFCCSELESVVLSDTVATVGKFAFCECTKLKELNIPRGIKSIGESAFMYCGSLTSVNLPDGIEYIGKFAFADCRSLTDIVLPQTIKFSGSGAFRGCGVKVKAPQKTGVVGFEIADGVLIKYSGKDADVLVPDGVKKIAKGAFSKNKFMESLTLPKSVTAIARRAIHGCINLKSISVEPGNLKFRADGGCLIDIKSRTVILAFSDSVIPSDGSVTAIAPESFAGVEIERLVIPDAVTTVGANAFSKCEKLKSLTIPESVTLIDSAAFSGCTALTEINFNATECADFYHSSYVFDNAGKSAEGIAVKFGANVKKIPQHLFDAGNSGDAPKIKSVIFEAGSVCEKIGYSAFKCCGEIANMILPDGITEIERDAFNECIALESINIPKSTTKIGSYAFYGCTKLKEIFIPKSVVAIHETAFGRCGRIEKITVEDGNPNYREYGNCLVDIEKRSLLHGTKNSVIPSDGSVELVENDSFSCCVGLKSIVIPNGIKKVLYDVFKDCCDLESVTVVDPATDVYPTAFTNCNNLRKITAPRTLVEKRDYFDLKDSNVEFVLTD